MLSLYEVGDSLLSDVGRHTEQGFHASESLALQMEGPSIVEPVSMI